MKKQKVLRIPWLSSGQDSLSTAGGVHSISDGETKIQKVMQHDQKEIKEIENLNRWITSQKTESIIKNLPKSKCPGQMSLPVNSSKYSKNYYQSFSDSSKKQKECFQIHFTRQTQTRQVCHKKRTLLCNISNKLTCKNSQQNISKPNSIIH